MAKSFQAQPPFAPDLPCDAPDDMAMKVGKRPKCPCIVCPRSDFWNLVHLRKALAEHEEPPPAMLHRSLGHIISKR